MSSFVAVVCVLFVLILFLEAAFEVSGCLLLRLPLVKCLLLSKLLCDLLLVLLQCLKLLELLGGLARSSDDRGLYDMESRLRIVDVFIVHSWLRPSNLLDLCFISIINCFLLSEFFSDVVSILSLLSLDLLFSLDALHLLLQRPLLLLEQSFADNRL